MRRPLPVMVIGGSVTPSSAEVIHEIAVQQYGLKEIRGYYGYDFDEHEFVHLPGADEGEPDQWPSRRLYDILKG